MTAIEPTSALAPTSATTSSTATNQLNQDTFLKLLVAQMKYQDPLSPTDSTQFLTQTAQFTEVSTLQKIEADQQSIQHTNQLLAASGMVGHSVTYATAGITATTPLATSALSVGGNLPQDAPVGARVDVSSSVYNNVGTKVPLQLEYTRTDSGWTVQASSKGQGIGDPAAVTFDATGQRTSADVTLSRSDLDAIDGTQGTWPAAGMTLTMGTPTDPMRLTQGAGASTLAVLEQNGGDGQSLSGIVTGIHVTADGPQLLIDGRSVPLSSISDVQASAY